MPLPWLNSRALPLRLLVAALVAHKSQCVHQTHLSRPTTPRSGTQLSSKLIGAKTMQASFKPILRTKFSRRTQHGPRGVRPLALRLSTDEISPSAFFLPSMPSLSDWRLFHAMLLPPRAAARCCRAFTGTILFMPAAAQHDPNNFPMPSDPHKSAEPADNTADEPAKCTSSQALHRPFCRSINRSITHILCCLSKSLSNCYATRLFHRLFHKTHAQPPSRPKSPYEVLRLTQLDYYALVLLSCTGLCTALGATRTLDAREIAQADGDLILRRELDEHVIRYLEASTARHASQRQLNSTYSSTAPSIHVSPPASSKPASASTSTIPGPQRSSNATPSSSALPSLRVVRRFEYEFRALALHVVMLHVAETGQPVPDAQGQPVPDAQGDISNAYEEPSRTDGADLPVLHLVELYSFGAPPTKARNSVCAPLTKARTAKAARLTPPLSTPVRLAAFSVAAAVAVAVVQIVARRC